MHTDARKIETDRLLSGDSCIVGAGAAGITIAKELAGRTTKVFLLEAGGFEREKSSQNIYRGKSVGLPYFPLHTARLRYFGGTTNHWNGWCSPLDPIDFQKRDYAPLSGWPISKEELEPYYKQAQKVCELGPYRWDVDNWEGEDRARLPFSRERLQTKIWQFSPPTRFGEEYKSEILQASNIHLLTHASVTQIEVNEPGSTVERVRVECLSGNRFWVQAGAYVLACGGIENARLLLASDETVAEGVGNQHDLVGRYFQEHPHIPRSGKLLVTSNETSLDLYRRTNVRGTDVIGCLQPSESFQKEQRILNYSVSLDFIPDPALRSLRRLKAGNSSDILSDVGNVVSDLDDLLGHTYKKLTGTDWSTYELFTRMEQAPNPESRVSLGRDRDALGMRQVRLNWQLTDMERRTIRTANMAIAREVGRLGLGRVQLPEWLMDDDAAWPSSLIGGWHHMGTTRMSESPTTGVVDANCKVHSVDNLYISGSSVFPTSGCANPTLTIIALALRLQDHLARSVLGP